MPVAERAARVAAAGLQGVAEVAGCSLRATRRAGCTSRCRLIAASTISSRDTIRIPPALPRTSIAVRCARLRHIPAVAGARQVSWSAAAAG
ncbi:hypothetical protein ACFROC_22355 [Nocardia tengchongensis]|uniref:hypothetical protein n=1 Tax=Nocardia tengchongensis TaxID=2055889 RepID=UPI0036CBB735